MILSLNEEVNIDACLASCAWCDDVHVLDSGSTDRTQEIARECGAEVHENPFTSFGAQRNWAIENIPTKHEWVFHLDADERFTPELVREMTELLKTQPSEAGYHVPSKLMFMGRWLKYSGGYPTYQMRLFHSGRMRFRDYGHGQRELTQGLVSTLQNAYIHHAFSKGLYDWFEKHNRYSSLEALQLLASRHDRIGLLDFIGGNPVKRRRAWKLLSYKLPARPLMRLCFTLFLQGGILEGRAGRSYATLLASYERMITLKVRWLKHRIATEEIETEIHESSFSSKSKRVFHASDEYLKTQQLHDPGSIVGVGDEIDAPMDQLGQLMPEASPWTTKEKILRAVWMLVGRPIFRMTFHNWYGIRRRILRLFGCKIGKDVAIRPSVHIEIPWNIDIRDGVTIGDNAILYSLGIITIGERTIVSQYAHICAGTHDHTDRRFPLIRDPITIGSDVWIGADAFVGPNVTLGNYSILGARSSAYKDLQAGQIHVGNPARAISKRELR
ncbi:MAG: glycosyltransferase [Planctomycetota bacterium]